jgi:Uma2 family endonuclease
MPDVAQVSVSEYLATTYRPDREYIDGELVERNVGEKGHGLTQLLLGAFLLRRRQEWSIQAITELRVQVSPTRFRIPDVCVLRGSAPAEEVITYPPLLCVEILSKDDRVKDLQQKVDDYFNMSVPCVWIIDPLARRGWEYTSEGMREAREGTMRVRSTPIEVPLSAIFE